MSKECDVKAGIIQGGSMKGQPQVVQNLKS